MRGGPEGEEVGIFHRAEGGLDVCLAAVGAHDLLIAPVSAIGEQDRLAEQACLQGLPGAGFEAPSQLDARAFAGGDLGAEQLIHMPAAQDAIHALASSLERGLLALGSPGTALQSYMQGFELAPAVIDLPTHRLHLGSIDRAV